MNELEINEYLQKIEIGLRESRQQMLEEYALRNDSIVVSDGNGGTMEVPAKELLTCVSDLSPQSFHR